MPKPSIDLILSDLHLGGSVCRALPLTRAIDRVKEECTIETVLLGGDIIDHAGFFSGRRVPETHRRVAEKIRQLGRRRLWVPGNHDRTLAQAIGECLAAETESESFLWEHGKTRCVMMHGDQFDDFEAGNVYVVALVDTVYRWGQKVSPLATRRIKQSLTTYRRVEHAVARGVAEKAAAHSAEIAFYGHMHNDRHDFFPDLGVNAYNIGCATDTPSSFLILHHTRERHREIERRFFE